MMNEPAAPSGVSAPEAGPSLVRRVLVGGGFIMGGYGAGQILRLASNLILARLLAPEAFGLMSIAISINIWAIMLTDIGVNASVIRSGNGDDAGFIRTAWTMGMVRNLAVWVIIALAAAAIALLASRGVAGPESIFANPLLPLVMLASGFQLPIDGFASMNSALAERRLAMKRVVALEVVRQVFTMVVTIGLAALGWGVWALVAGALSGSAFNAVLSHVVYPGPRMALQFDRAHASEIFHFGKWLIIASFFGFILNRGDQLIFGWAMPAGAFSLYAIAAVWVSAAVSVVQTIVSRIFYPAFSEVLRTSPEILGAVYEKARLPLDAFALVCAFGAFFLAEPVFALIYPQEYAGVGHFVKLLAPSMLFLPYRLINVAALASGDSRGFTMVTVVAGGAMAAITPFLISAAGVDLAILFYACIAGFSLPVIWRIGRRVMPLNVFTEGRMAAAAILLAVLILATGKA